jgi:TolB protein
VAANPLVRTAADKTYQLVTVPQETFKGQGELCDLQVSPDSCYAAVSICATEGVIFDVFVVDITQGTGFQIGICQQDIERGCRFKPTWFRGWFPDSHRVLLMSDWLEILDIETGESRRITPEGETVTDAAVSPDGQTIVYTIIQGDRLIFIDTTGRLLYEVPAPSPKPGGRPEFISWSPNGRFIAYIWDQTVIQFNSFGPLWVTDVQTGEQWPLSPAGVFDSFPTWSPQGDQILVVRRENMEDRSADFDLNKLASNLWVVEVPSRRWRQLTSLKGQGAWSPVWTPDGSAVVFMANLDGQPNAWMIHADGSGLTQLTTDSPMMPRSVDVTR